MPTMQSSGGARLLDQGTSGMVGPVSGKCSHCQQRFLDDEQAEKHNHPSYHCGCGKTVESGENFLKHLMDCKKHSIRQPTNFCE